MLFLYYSMFYLFLHFSLFMVLLILGEGGVLYLDWCLNSSLSMHYAIMLDYVSMGFLSFVFLITFCVMKYSCSYMGGTGSMMKRFIILVSLFVMSMGLLIISPSFLLMMLGWDGLGVISFLLVIYYNNFSSLTSGLVTVYLNRFGDYFMVLSFWILFGELSFYLSSFYFSSFVFFSVFFILLASMTKSAQLPFSSWLPAAMAAPTPVSSLVHSSTLVTAGVYVMIRYFYLSELMLLMNGLMWISLLTCLGAGTIACYENDLKKLVAMSTLSQLGLMVFVYSLGEVFYSYYHMVCHALFKALLFLGCGLCIMYMYGSQDSRFMSSLGTLVFSNLIFIFISVLSLMGFPFLTGFYSKDSVIEVCFLKSPVLIVYMFLILACLLTGLYGLKSIYIMMKSQSNSNYCYAGTYSYMIWLGMSILCFWSICLGKMYSLLHMKLEEGILLIYFKLGGLMIVFFSIFLFLMFFWFSIFLYSFKSFFGDMYFLNWIFGSFSSSSLETFLWLTMGELTWLIFLGPSMIFHYFYSLSNLLSFMDMGFKVSLLTVFMFCFLGFFFVYSLYKVLNWSFKEWMQKDFKVYT